MKAEWCKANTNVVKVDLVLLNELSDGTGISEAGNSLAELIERENEGLGSGSGELGLGLVTKDDQGLLLGRSVDGSLASELLGDGRVDAATETTVGGADDPEGLLVAGLATVFRGNGLSSLGLVKDDAVGSAVLLSLAHGILGLAETGGGNHLCDTRDSACWLLDPGHVDAGGWLTFCSTERKRRVSNMLDGYN